MHIINRDLDLKKHLELWQTIYREARGTLKRKLHAYLSVSGARTRGNGSENDGEEKEVNYKHENEGDNDVRGESLSR